MEEVRVTYETACMLIDTDFQILCPSNITYTYLAPVQDLIPYQVSYDPTESRFINISCPTQALVAKWLRDIHHIFIEVELVKRTNYRFRLCLIDKKWPNTLDFEQEYKTYEEALEPALQESILIVKKLNEIANP